MVPPHGLIRVAFRPLGSATWLGGKHYLWNLLYALGQLEQPRVQPVLVAEAGEVGDLASLPGVELAETRGLFGHRLAFLSGRVCKRLLARDLVAEHWLRRARAALSSHGSLNGRRSSVPTLFWIPDLQHLHLPAYFDAAERRRRDRGFREGLDDAALVILSSETARRDVASYYGESSAARCRVLRFVSQPRLSPAQLPPLDRLVAEQGVPRRYFHLPNQFWKHKNHQLVVEALAQATQRVPELTVIATGAREDFRNPEHYAELMDLVRRRGLSQRFLHLGTVPFPVLVGLMTHAVAILNPSRFEGWSSTVEEAKSLGKAVLLSDLAVHREQAPARGAYFDPDDPSRLADLLVETAAGFDPAAEQAAAEDARRDLPERTRRFALAYEDIVVEAVSAASARRAG